MTAAPFTLAGLSLSPRTLLMVGVPIAGIAALMSSRKKTTTPTGVMVATPNGNDTAIGTGQLTEFENSILSALSSIQPPTDAGSSTTPTAAPPSTTTPAPAPVATPTSPSVAAPVVMPVVGTLNNQPVVQTQQGYTGQFLVPAPQVNYGGIVDLVDPRSGLAVISGLPADQAANYAGYTVVAHNTVPVPTGGK